MGFLERLIPSSIKKNIYNEGFNAGRHNVSVLDESKSLQKLFESSDSVKEFEKRIRDLRYSDDSESIALLTSAYIHISNTRSEIISSVDEVRKFYIVNVILDQLTQDSLAPDINTNEILELTSPKIRIKRELDYLMNKFNLNRLVEDIVPDMCAYGDYTLSPVTTDIEGLTDIKDDINQAKVVPLINRGEILGYIFMDDEDTKLRFSGPTRFLCFSMLSSRVRVDISSESIMRSGVSVFSTSNNTGYSLNWNLPNQGKVIDENSVLPRYLRIGKSIIYPIIDKLKELELLELLVPASKLSSLSRGALLGMNVPVTAGINVGFEAAKRMESIINAKIGFSGQNNMLTADQIINAAGKTKVIPLFGEKGVLSKMEDGHSNDQDLMSSIDDTRRVICSSMGIPYEILFGGDGGNKSDLLKRHSRYLRKVRGIQHSISFAIKNLCSIHLKAKGIDHELDDIEVSFRNKIMDISEIENLEFKDTSLGILQNFSNTMQSVSQLPGFQNAIDNKALAVFIKEVFDTIGVSGIIDINKVTNDSSQGDEETADSDFFGGDLGSDLEGEEDFGMDDISGEVSLEGGEGVDTGSEPDLGNGNPEITPAGNTNET